MRLIRLSQNQIALIFKCIVLAVTKIWSSNLLQTYLSVERVVFSFRSMNREKIFAMTSRETRRTIL